MIIEVRKEAEEDIEKASRFYEMQKKGLGAYFIDAIISDIESLLIYAGIHQKINEYYRLLSKRFPYSIYYRLDNEVIEIHAVLDNRMHPQKHFKRLKD